MRVGCGLRGLIPFLFLNCFHCDVCSKIGAFQKKSVNISTDLNSDPLGESPTFFSQMFMFNSPQLMSCFVLSWLKTSPETDLKFISSRCQSCCCQHLQHQEGNGTTGWRRTAWHRSSLNPDVIKHRETHTDYITDICANNLRSQH